jgi:ATP-dependent Clp protease ATP-binding subunit ClpX
VDGASQVLAREAGKAENSDVLTLKRPREIFEALSETVIAQDEAKREVAIAVYEHYRRRATNGIVQVDGEEIEVEKSNILMLGPSGCGKTHIARGVARTLGVPFYVADCTRLTQSGYVGDDVESVLQGLLADANQSIEQAEWGIVVLDEFDKLGRKSGRGVSGYRDVTGEGVQQALLKLLEGSKVAVPRGMGVRSVSGLTRCDTVDTKNILFIAAGSFAGIEEVIADRLNKSAGIGFGSSRREKYDKTALYRHVTTDDIEEFGMIPEIVGRLPVITSIYELTEDELVRVLIEPKNALCKQFRGLFSLDGVDLQFDPEALREIARLAKKRSTGARALRAIMKAVLKSYSFEVPDQCDIASIRITAEAVHNPGAALIGRSPAAGTA